MPMVGGAVALPQLHGAKKLSDDELKGSLQRLYEQPCARQKAKREGDHREIAENMMKNSCKSHGREQTERDREACKRLYDHPLAVQRNLLTYLEKKHIAQLDAGHPKVKLTSEQSEEAVHRLYTQSVDHKKSIREQTEKKVYGEAPAPRKLTNETLKENIEKLYNKAVEAKTEKKAALREKYGWRSNSNKKISKTELNDLVTRLGAKT